MRNLSLNIFRVYGKCDISGNIMSIIDNGKCRQTTIPGTGCFAHLFSFNDIRNANNLQLPATQLTSYCYESMFSGCDKLISIPELPATNLAENCYSGMFQGCRSLEIDSDWFVNNIFNRQNMIFDKG
ncbi:MAG: hypothetical protein MJ219_00550 [Mycoplasmoidaceae bacterium]|nr:hypothetical protein [Mycoplasmoidaceae bacterium]